MKHFLVKSKTYAAKKNQPGHEAGFTLIEILIAFTIFAIGILAVASMQIRSMQVNSLANNITESSTWAQDKMEELITLDWGDTDLAHGAGHTDTAPDGTPVTWEVQDVNLDGDASTAELKRITMESDYKNRPGNTKKVTLTSAYPRLTAP
jgi:type IV pilus modification protein PilV